MSRAAEKPLPPPPVGSVWERIEQARAREGLTYGKLSKLAKKSISQYRQIGTRGWGTHGKTRDAFVQALVDLGWLREWLLTGVGEQRTDGRVLSVSDRRPPGQEELRRMRWRAIEELVETDGIEIARAQRLVARVRIFPHPDLSWGDYHSSARHLAREEDDKAADRARAKKKPGA